MSVVGLKGRVVAIACCQLYVVAVSNTLLGLLSTSLLSLSSLVVVLVRISPLLDPAYALSFLFLTFFFTVGTMSSSLLIALHVYLLKAAAPRSGASAPTTGDAQSLLRSSLRRGFLFALASCIILFLHLLHVLTWWIAGLVYLVLILVELAVEEG